MKLQHILLAGAVMLATNLTAQTTGGIDQKMLDEIRQGYTATTAQKAVRNALASNSIAVLATNAFPARIGFVRQLMKPISLFGTINPTYSPIKRDNSIFA